jgi:hypothetical protein
MSLTSRSAILGAFSAAAGWSAPDGRSATHWSTFALADVPPEEGADAAGVDHVQAH